MSKASVLKKIYENDKDIAGFSGEQKLLKASIKCRKDITLKDVKQFLNKQRSYTLHGNIHKKYLKRPIIVFGPGKTVGGDLADLSSLKKHNKNYKYLLILIDIFSRKLYVTPLKNKTNKLLALEFEKFIRHETKYKYDKLFVDEGTEFKGQYMDEILKKYDIHRYSIYNRAFKCSIAERVIQTIKRKIYKRMTHFNTKNYIDSLQNIVEGYNKTPHKGLGYKTPNFVHGLTNYQDILDQYTTQYQQKLKNYVGYKKENIENSFSQRNTLEEGTFVRLLTAKAVGLFVKSFDHNYTEEIFVIRKVVKLIPTRYYLKDLLGDHIDGTVYRDELKETHLPETFPIEKILKTEIDKKTGKKMYHVRFLGYPPKFDGWVEHVEKI